MAATCFEREGLSLGRRLFIEIWYGTLYMQSVNSLVGIGKAIPLQAVFIRGRTGIIIYRNIFYCASLS
jgi:hypothetical protein